MSPVYERKFVLLQPQRHLNLQGGTQLKQQFAAIDSEPGSFWIVDMALVEFIDSAGLVALISALNAAVRGNCHLVLCNVSPAIKLVLEITQLDQAFEMADSITRITETVSPPPETPTSTEQIAA